LTALMTVAGPRFDFANVESKLTAPATGSAGFGFRGKLVFILNNSLSGI
jgi:hypothetical protein